MSGDAKRHDGAVEVFYPPLAAPAEQKRAQRRFWPKLLRVVGRIPFAEDLAAAYYCAIDPATPARVKAVLMGAVVYFVLPTDLVPDFIAAIGFTDDAAVLATTLGIVGAHIKRRHREQARERLGKPRAAE